MSIYLFGPLIKQRREELGYTQEDLADGICSVPTLSRIENGERIPTKEHSERLLQRLGYSDIIQVQFVSERTFRDHELKYCIRQAFVSKRWDEAKALLEQYISTADQNDCLSKQFILFHKTALAATTMPLHEQLTLLAEAINLTCPRYNSESLPDFLSYDEILIINSIAICYGDLGEYDEAIRLLYALKRHYDNHMVNQEEIMRTQLLVLYNLSKYLGCASRFDECIEICDLGIRISRETKKCSQLDKMLYNKAWALIHRGRTEDLPIAKEALRLAINLAEALGTESLMKHYIQFMNQHF